MVLGVLGYKVFIPFLNTTEKIIEKNQKESKFYLSRKSKKSQQCTAPQKLDFYV